MKRCAIIIVVLLWTISLSAMGTSPKQEQKTVIIPKEKSVLWNGKDFTGWKKVVKDPNIDANGVWTAKDGLVYCTGQSRGYMRTEADYANYKLHVEYRWPVEGGNNGVFVHIQMPDKVWPQTIECQLHSGYAGDFWILGGGIVDIKQHKEKGSRVDGRNVKKLQASSEKPIGQWNVYEVICMDDWVVILVNGVVQNIGTHCTVTSGKVGIQTEGSPIEFRNIYIEPVE